MLTIQAAALLFVAGLTTAGVSGTLFELLAREPLRFAPPFVSRHHVWRSLLVAGLAGPFMLGNDALDARRAGRISGLELGICGIGAGLWALAWGAMVIALAGAVAA